MTASRVLLLIFSLQFSVWAATVELKDGRSYRATDVTETAWGYSLKMNGSTIQLPRSMVASVSESDDGAAAPADGQIVVNEPGDGPALIIGGAVPRPHGVVRAERNEREAINVSHEPADESINVSAERPVFRLPLPASEMDRRRLRNAIEALGFESTNDRADAHRALTNAGDAGLAALIEYGIYHEVPSIRTDAVRLLGRLGGKRVLKPLIEAFFAAAGPTVPPYNVNYVEALGSVISNITGQNFALYARRSARGPEVASAMAQWWKNSSDSLPPQIGEPELDPRAPTNVSVVRDMRELNLQRREFGGFNHPIGLVEPRSGRDLEPMPTYIPTMPRNVINDRQYSQSFTPGANKSVGEGRDYPGEWREQERINRAMGR